MNLLLTKVKKCKMARVSIYMKCPRCKEDGCNNEHNYKTGEYYLQCMHCGYHNSFRYERDDEGEYIKKDPLKDSSFDNFKGEEFEVKEPFGSYKYIFKDGPSFHGTIADITEYDSRLADFKTMEKDDIASFSISRLIDGKIQVTIIYEAETKGA